MKKEDKKLLFGAIVFLIGVIGIISFAILVPPIPDEVSLKPLIILGIIFFVGLEVWYLRKGEELSQSEPIKHFWTYLMDNFILLAISALSAFVFNGWYILMMHIGLNAKTVIIWSFEHPGFFKVLFWIAVVLFVKYMLYLKFIKNRKKRKRR